MAPFVKDNLGKKVTMVYPDFAFGHDQRDYFSAAFECVNTSRATKIDKIYLNIFISPP